MNNEELSEAIKHLEEAKRIIVEDLMTFDTVEYSEMELNHLNKNLSEAVKNMTKGETGLMLAKAVIDEDNE